ncbi:baeRF12 domain-containing protein [Erythrobacter mangrovi]|uniref:Host attachment protein n=1 Tax=Erythrobacter mangrovi TaxID=2739433 RepID=A0A7D4ASU0_9SPHN|nr:host attachment family protein [Erythrobacter mangrovi]QKG70397.1 host attachment protein [Erythrobacter mangrovi]
MQVEHGTIVLVADGAKLLLFRNEGDRKYAVLETLSHDAIEDAPTREHGTDTPGRTQSSIGDRRSSYGEPDWHSRSEDDFARHAAALCEQTAAAHPEAGIVVIATPRTLGELRKYYGRETARRLLAEIDKDLASHTTDDVIATLAAHQ